MDGGSKDGTVAMVESYIANDPRIKIYSEPDEGALHALEKGLTRATGDYLILACGQDYFSDPNWFSVAMKVLEEDKQVSLVWALGRGITEEGKDIGTNASYAHFIDGRGKLEVLWIFIIKCLDIAKNLLFAGWEKKKFTLRKIFSKAAPLRVHSITTSGFTKEKFPQKEDWFFYWLKTGLVFPDQCLVVSKKVYVECAPRYNIGSKRLNSFGDFVFNFNTKGYMAYFIPAYVGYGLLHASSSGNRAARGIYLEAEKYFSMIQAFKKNNLGKMITFRDRDGNFVSERKVN